MCVVTYRTIHHYLVLFCFRLVSFTIEIRDMLVK